METPWISIVVPAYKAEKTVGKTLESICSQTYPHWEAIVINDCSPDGTLAVLEAAAAQDPRIRVYTNEKNSGVSFTRNRAVDLARGEWIAFLDSDDYWLPEKLEKQMALAEQHPDCGLFYTGSAFVDENGDAFDYTMPVPERVDYRELMKQNVISCSSVLVRRELLRRYPMENDAVHEDFAVWLRILRDGTEARGVNEPLLVYRVSRNSKSGNKKKAVLMTWKTYLFVGIPWYQAAWNMCFYAFRSLRKYRSIRS